MNQIDLEDLIRKGERKNIDFKGACAFEDDFRPHLTVTVTSMANTADGGTIIVGVEKKGGVHVLVGLAPGELATFDKTPMTQYMKGRIEPLPVFTVETLILPIGAFVIIQVREFEDVPLVVAKSLQGGKKEYAREGDLLIRTEAAQSRRVSSAEEMRELLDRGMTKRSEHVLAVVSSMIAGASPRGSST